MGGFIESVTPPSLSHLVTRVAFESLGTAYYSDCCSKNICRNDTFSLVAAFLQTLA